MGDVASLAVGLHLDAANFKSQLAGAFTGAENSSSRFNRRAQSDAKKTAVAYDGITTSIRRLGRQFALFSGGGLSLGYLIATTRQYEQSLADLSVISGLTGNNLKILDAAAQEMGRTTEYTASQAAEALKLMGAAKPELLKTADGLAEVTKSALVLAQAAGMSLPDATKGLALSLNQFGAGAAQADRFINVLAAGSRYGASEIEKTTAAIKNGGVAANQAGLSFEQYNASVQALSTHGVFGGEAGTGIRNVILALEKGKNSQLKPSIVGWNTALDNLSKQGLSTAEAIKLFGVRTYGVATILVQSRDKVDEYTKSITGTEIAHEQASVRVNTLDGDLKALSSSVENVFIQAGKQNGGAFRTAIQDTTAAIRLLGDNFTTVSNIALYTLIPIMGTKMTAGLRAQVSSWRSLSKETQNAARQQALTAQKTIDEAKATIALTEAQGQHISKMIAQNREYGISVSYEKERTALIRQETEAMRAQTVATEQLAAAKRQMSVISRTAGVAAGVLGGALNLVGGPFGAAMLAGSALMYFADQSEEARKAAIDAKEATHELLAELLKLSGVKLLDRQNDLQDKIKAQKEQINSALEQVAYINAKQSQYQLLGSNNDVLDRQKTHVLAELEDMRAGLSTLQKAADDTAYALSMVGSGLPSKINNLQGDLAAIGVIPKDPVEKGADKPAWTGSSGETKAKKVDTYRQLQLEIEKEHASSLERINLQERASQQKLLEAAKASKASGADVARLTLLNEENYQKKRLELAERYAPVQAEIRQEKESMQELKVLHDAQLLSDKEYQAAKLSLYQKSTRDILKSQAEAAAMPKQNIAGDVDPVINLQNQLAKQQALYNAYYTAGLIDKNRYEQLMTAATTNSTNAQYQQALTLYSAQSQSNKMIIELAQSAKERTSNALTGILTGTQSFKTAMVNLFSSLTEVIIKDLVDMAAQALITNTILKSILGIGGVVAGVPTAAPTASGGMGMPTDFHAYASAGMMAPPPTISATRSVAPPAAKSAQGDGSRVTFNQTNHYTVKSDDQGGGISPQALAALNEQVKRTTLSVISDQQRNGGMLHNGG